MLFGYEHNIPTIGTATWFGVPQYLTFTLNEHASVTARVELFYDPQGNRTGAAGLYSSGTVSSGTVSSGTVGVSYRPTSWLILRPEVRYDHNNGSGAFEGKRGLLTATADAIVRW